MGDRAISAGRPRAAAVRRAAVVVVGLAVLVSCGGSDDTAAPDPDDTAAVVTNDATVETEASSGEIESVPSDRVLAGLVREPLPVVSDTTVPSLTVPGEDVEFRAEPGGLEVVYFGYTNCPDVCPTTMFDLTVALRMLPDEMADQVETVMVTVDPDRDLELLPGYVESFIPDGIAAGTSDADRLASAAQPFGVSYDVTTLDTGEIEVSHSGFLYAVNDQGELVVAWPFGTSSEEMAMDMFQLLEQEQDAE